MIEPGAVKPEAARPASLAPAGRLGSDALLFLAGSALSLLIGFPLQIFVARHLGADQLGLFSLYEAAMMTGADILSLGIGATLVRFIPQHLEKGQHQDLRTLVSSSLALLLALGLIGFAVAIGIGLQWGEALGLTAHNQWAYYTATAVIPLTLLSFAVSQSLRGFLAVKTIVIGQNVVQLLVKAVLAVGLLTLGLGLTGYVAAIVVANCAALMWLTAGLYRKVAALPVTDDASSPNQHGTWFRFAAYNYSGILLGAITSRLDRFVLGYHLSTAAVGVGVVAMSLNSLPMIFHRVMLAVASPVFTQLHTAGDRPALIRTFQLTTDWIMRATLPFAIFMAIFAVPLLDLYGPGFSETGAPALRLLILAQLLMAAAGPVGALLNATGGERPVFILSSIAAALNIIGLLVLVPYFGVMGWAIAHLTVNIFHAVLAVIILSTTFNTSWWSPRYSTWVLPGLGTIALAVTLLQTLEPNSPLGLMAAFVACALTYVALLVFAGLSPEDRELITSLKAQFMTRRTSP